MKLIRSGLTPDYWGLLGILRVGRRVGGRVGRYVDQTLVREEEYVRPIYINKMRQRLFVDNREVGG